MTITTPGIYDIPERDYHADTLLAPPFGPSLSVSGAKTILKSPAKYRWELDHPTGPTETMEFGTAVHTLVLGSGPEITVVDADSWRTLQAKATAREARDNGRIPLLKADAERAHEVANAVLAHPTIGQAFTNGQPEQSLYWVDERTGTTCRARVDWLRSNALVDLKTAADASPTGFVKSVANFGYHQQAAYYQTGAAALGLGDLPFIFVAVEKTPPYLVAWYQLDNEAVEVGAARNRRALDMYADCTANNEWPGLSPDIETLSLPRWATY